MDKSEHKLASLSIFFPCFNEAKNIDLLVKDAYKIAPLIADKFEVLIVNDGSIDTTKLVVKKLQEKYSFLRLVNHSKNKGYGAALKTGIRESQYDWIFFSDGDGQFNLSQLKDFVSKAQSNDIIIGYRTNRAEGKFRAINARFFKLFIDVLFRLHVKDIDCAFKLMKAETIKAITLKSDGAMISSEILYRLKKKGMHFVQLPVTHLPRKHGEPTGNNPKVVIKAGIEALNLYKDMKFGFSK